MTNEEWKERYCARLIDVAGISKEDAESFFSNMDEPEFDLDPEYCADEEMSYWTDDGD